MARTIAAINSTPRSLRDLIMPTVGLLVTGLVVCVLVWGWGYYSLSQAERPFHDDHGILRPSSFAGILLGVAAVGLFVLNLGYLIRKRFVGVHWIGSVGVWMDLHVVTGIVGGGLIILHSAVALYSALGIVSFVSMGITVITGVIGRYIYIRVPHSLEGRELELEQIQDEIEGCRHQLEDVGIEAAWLRVQDKVREHHRVTGIMASFVSLVAGDHDSRCDYRNLKEMVMSSPELRPLAERILPLARTFCRERQWIIRYHELRGLLASWRFFHRWLAVLMLVVVTFHIVLAVWFGDLWILGGKA